MDTKKIYILIVIIILKLSLTTYAVNDSLSIDTRWRNLTINTLSNSGKWLSYTLSNSDSSNMDSLFIINTKNQNNHNISSLLKNTASNIHLEFLNDYKAVYKKDEYLYLIDLKTFKKDSLMHIKKHTIIQESKTLIVLNKKGYLQIDDTNNQTIKTRLKMGNIEDYIMNPLNNLLLVKTLNNTLSVINLESNTLSVINGEFLSKLTKPIWNTNQTTFLIKKDSSSFYLVDINKKATQTISIPIKETNAISQNVYFNQNDDIIFSYIKKIDSISINKDSDFIDIWNGNAKNLHLKNLNYQPLYKNTNIVYLYQQSSKQIKLIHNNDSLQILPIEIPNHIIYFDPTKNVDYKSIYPKNEYLLKNIHSLDTLTLTIDNNLENTLNLSPDAKLILYPKNENWEILNLETYQKTTTNIPIESSFTYWTKNSKSIIYSTDNTISKFDLSTQSYKSLITFTKTGRVHIRNTYKTKVSKYVDLDKSLLILFIDVANTTSLLTYNNQKINYIERATNNRINSYGVKFTDNLKTIIYSVENFNLPPNLISFSSNQSKLLLQNYIPQELYNWRKQKQFFIKDNRNKEISATLYYPKNFNANHLYPMVVHIYDIQKNDANIFDIPSLYTDNGFNISLLTERGYFVLLPDTYVDINGTGIAALEQTDMIIDNVLYNEKSINPNKIGLKGHSFGAYKTAFITTHSNKYACSVASSGVYDLVMSNYSYNYALKKPNYPRLEDHQWYLGDSFAKNPNKYLVNSPILFAQNTKTPTLLWAGMKDKNVPWEQTRHFYIALKKYNNPVIALFYKNINHVLDRNITSSTTKKESIDILTRTLQWYDYFLKDDKEIQWITNGITTN